MRDGEKIMPTYFPHDGWPFVGEAPLVTLFYFPDSGERLRSGYRSRLRKSRGRRGSGESRGKAAVRGLSGFAMGLAHVAIHRGVVVSDAKVWWMDR